jgi:hypothetical protein
MILLNHSWAYISKNVNQHTTETAAHHVYCKLWNKSRYPTMDEWTKRIWHIHTREYYSAIKNETMSSAGKWMKL